jgi:hypothetical protein
VEHDIKEDGWFFHPEEGLEEYKVTRTADRKKFCYPLNNPEEDGLEDINLRRPLPSVLRTVELMFPSL